MHEVVIACGADNGTLCYKVTRRRNESWPTAPTGWLKSLSSKPKPNRQATVARPAPPKKWAEELQPNLGSCGVLLSKSRTPCNLGFNTAEAGCYAQSVPKKLQACNLPPFVYLWLVGNGRMVGIGDI